MEEKSLSQQESLQLITKMINQAKNHYYESGLGALLWGFTNFICFTLAYLDATAKWFNMAFNTFYLMGITFIPGFILRARFYKNKAKSKDGL
jgi:hypothetical protein